MKINYCLFLLISLITFGCAGLSGTDSGNPPAEGYETTVATNLGQWICDTLLSCESEMDFIECDEKVLSAEIDGASLGLDEYVKITLYEIHFIEQEEALSIDPIMAQACINQIRSLECEDPLLEDVWDPAFPEDYHIKDFLLDISYCSKIYS